MIDLLQEARGETSREAPINLPDYEAVIVELRKKNLSFAKIAEWLAERLGRPVNRGGVYRVYADWEQREEDESIYRDQHQDVGYYEAVDEMAKSLFEAALTYEKENECSGFGDEALEKAARMYEQRRADERAAAEADAKEEKPE